MQRSEDTMILLKNVLLRTIASLKQLIFILAWICLFSVQFIACETGERENNQTYQTSHQFEKLGKSSHFVGRDSCSECHAREAELWRDSDHDMAMQEVSDSTVLGNFNNSTFTQQGITSKFYRKGSGFFVETEGSRWKNEGV